MFQIGILPPAGPATAGGPGGSPGPSGGPAPSGGGGGAQPPPGAQVVIAKGIEYDVKTLEVDGGKPFTLFFENQDATGVFHDIDLRSEDGSQLVQDQPTIDGGASQAYQYDALQPGTYERAVNAVDALKPIAARYGRTVPQLAIQWLTSRPGVSSPLVGARTVKELEENVESAGWTISDADIAAIDRITAPVWAEIKDKGDMFGFRARQRQEQQAKRA